MSEIHAVEPRGEDSILSHQPGVAANEKEKEALGALHE